MSTNSGSAGANYATRARAWAAATTYPTNNAPAADNYAAHAKAWDTPDGPPLGTDTPDGPPLGTASPSVFQNSKKQLSPEEMAKVEKLVIWNNSIFSRIYSIVKRKLCPTKPKCEFDLATYSIKLLSEPRPSDAEVYDMLRQLIALNQILNNEREITKDTVTIFQNAKGLSLLSGAAILGSCVGGAIIGLFAGLAGSLLIVSHLIEVGSDTESYRSWLSDNPEPTVERYRLAYPDASREDIQKWVYDFHKDWKKHSDAVAFAIGKTVKRDLWNFVTAGTGTAIVSLGISTALGIPALPIAAGAAKGAASLISSVCKKINVYEVIREITYLLKICEVKYPDIYRDVSLSLSTTVVNPLRSMSLQNFTASGVPTRMNNFLKKNSTTVINPLSSVPTKSGNKKGGRMSRYKKRKTLKKRK
jgi:hypothetical protein